ncbi:hypothetical protein [Aestuariivirga litoralis]|uniref:hypothetical protein n=1 Tax=Aestuariivirga litoralis TaxID=2650924 RepID=UPI0018C7FA6A|nr:hypothetical protein [Aestuariivirga litoralis]MBG1233235.1 hypothetical protein [Aestuariivirga litoralis]
MNRPGIAQGPVRFDSYESGGTKPSLVPIVFKWLFLAFWIPCLAFPFAFVWVKLFGGTALIALIWMRGIRQVDASDLAVVVILVLGAIYLGIPYSNGAIGQFELGYLVPLHIVFPLYWWLMLRNLRWQDLNLLSDATFAAAWLSLAYSMGLLLESAGLLPVPMPHFYEVENTDLNSLRVASSAVSGLLFSAPVVAIHLLERKSMLANAVLLIFAVGILATGRRSILFGIVIAVVINQLVFVSNMKARIAALVSLCALLVAGSIMYAFDYLSLQSMLSERWDTLSLYDEMARVDQTYSLLEGFWKHPVIGNGLGSSVAVIRDEVTPWRYELSYIAALFRYGVLACGLLLWLYVTPVIRVFSHYSQLQPKQRALIVGVLGAYIAYAFNPVLDAFDAVWISFLPFLMSSLLRERAQTAGADDGRRVRKYSTS